MPCRCSLWQSCMFNSQETVCLQEPLLSNCAAAPQLCPWCWKAAACLLFVYSLICCTACKPLEFTLLSTYETTTWLWMQSDSARPKLISAKKTSTHADLMRGGKKIAHLCVSCLKLGCKPTCVFVLISAEKSEYVSRCWRSKQPRTHAGVKFADEDVRLHVGNTRVSPACGCVSHGVIPPSSSSPPQLWTEQHRRFPKKKMF